MCLGSINKILFIIVITYSDFILWHVIGTWVFNRSIMMKAPLPYNEKQRLKTLLDLEILDTETDEFYDDLADLTATLCDVEFAGISFIDKDRQWFKATVNIEVKEMPRATSFCGHAILQDDVMVVNNTLEDARFVDSPNVAGGYNIRFYAGAPIICDNSKVGTVCIFDRSPNKFLTVNQIKGLKTISAQVSKMLELKLKNNEIKMIAAKYMEVEKNIAHLNILKNEIKNDEIAYELHENIAQIIAAAKLTVERVEKVSPSAKDDVLKIKEYLTIILSDVISLSKSVTPTTLKNANYFDYIERMIDNFRKSTSIKVDFLKENCNFALTSIIGLPLYRIIQYQLNFAVLTEATYINLLIKKNIQISVTFEHNGKDEICETVEADLYLNNINTRAQIIGATFKNDTLKKRMNIISELQEV